MEIVILLFVYVALFNSPNDALDNGQQHGPEPFLTSIHPFFMPIGSRIAIQRMRNGTRVPNTVIYGTLRRVPMDYLPTDHNDPYGHAFVVIDENIHFHARLGPGRSYDHNINDGSPNIPNEFQTYTCYLRRPPYRGLRATLIPVNRVHMHDFPYVHYMNSYGVHAEGELTHLSVDDVAITQRQNDDAP